MPPINPLPLPDRISENIRATLAAIVGDGVEYSYTPDVVEFVEDLSVDKLPKGKQVVYWLFPGDHKPAEQASHTHEYTDYLSIFAAWRAPVPYGSAPIPKTIRYLLGEDIKRALTKDVSRNGLARNTEITEISPVDVDNTVKWIGISAFIVITSRETRFPA